MKDQRKRPRFIQKIIAFLSGHFWLPCPICNEYFGGHEWKTYNASLMINEHEGEGVCKNCVEEAKKRNKILFEFFNKQENSDTKRSLFQEEDF